MILTNETKQNYTGIGIYKRHDRNYIGDYVDGNEHGIGTYESRIIDNIPNHKYAGQFNDNKAEGIGIKLYGHGGKYCGGYKNNKPHGLGYWKLPSGAIFIGEYKDQVPDGFGMLTTWDGFKFIGYVRGWMPVNGKWYDQEDNEIDITELGYNKNGTEYVGEFKDGKKHGQGTETLPNGTEYVGEWQDDKWHGQGTLTFPDGKKYVGEFKEGKTHGQGTLNFPDGGKYVGEFNDGKFLK